MIIYKVTNLINGKIYIGQTIKSLKHRKSCHKSEAFKKCENIYFHRAIRKHGFDNFEWTIIDTALNEKELNEKEIYWIAEYRKTHVCYNMSNGGDGNTSVWVGRKHTEETKKKMSEAAKGHKRNSGVNNSRRGKTLSEETKKKLSDAKMGIKLSDETRKKMSESHKGMKNNCDFNGENNPFYGKKHSEETKRKISETKKRKRQCQLSN